MVESIFNRVSLLGLVYFITSFFWQEMPLVAWNHNKTLFNPVKDKASAFTILIVGISLERHLPYFSDHRAHWIIRRIERNKTVR